MADSYDFIVVGGGVGGLVLARRLILGGRSVLVLEASDHAGGTVARHTVGGIELDAGAESFATRGGTVAKLVRSLGLGDDIVDPNPQGAWLQPASGPAFRLPTGSLLGIPGSPMATDVTDIIGMRAGFRAFAETLLPPMVGAKSVTLGELVRRRMGRAVLDQLVRPIVRGVHSADADDLPLDQAAPGLRKAMLREGSLAGAVRDLRATSERAGSAVAGIRGGVFRIVDALCADLERFGVEVRLGSRASGIQAGSVQVGADTIRGTVIRAAAGLDGNGSGGGGSGGGESGGGTPASTRVVLATLVVDQPLLDAAPRGTGVLVAEGAPGVSARALTHATAKWSWLAERSSGRHVLRLSYDTAPEDFARVAREDASALLGVPLTESALLDFATVEWYRPPRVAPTPHEIPLVGESIAGTGLASVVARSEALARILLEDADGEPGLP